MSTVSVVGGSTFDVLAPGLSRLPEIDPAGDEFTDRSLVHLEEPPVLSVGGNGGNLAFTLARLGSVTRLFTSLGDDALGRWLAGQLELAGCELSLVPPSSTSFNFVVTNRDGKRRSYFYPVTLDSEAGLELVERTRFEPGDHLALTGYPHPHPVLLTAWAERAHSAGATVSLDIGPVTAGFGLSDLGPLLPYVDLIFCNQVELAALDHREDPSRIADRLSRELGLGVVLKKGRSGSEFIGRERRISVPAVPTDARVTVGAGDAFDAGFIHSTVTDGRDIEMSLRFATAVVAHILAEGRGVGGAPTASAVYASFRSNHR
jgi:sugar/nucleoside kinase (ribokinase family)